MVIFYAYLSQSWGIKQTIIDAFVHILWRRRAPWPSIWGVIFKFRAPMAPGALLGKPLIYHVYEKKIVFERYPAFKNSPATQEWTDWPLALEFSKCQYPPSPPVFEAQILSYLM